MGAGSPAEEADPGLLPALLGLVEPTRRGDPESALSWTTLSVRRLAAELTAAGHPVTGETVGKLLRANGLGLNVHAELDTGTYPTGVKISDQQMKALEDDGTLTRHDWHGEWNYTLHPKTARVEN